MTKITYSESTQLLKVLLHTDLSVDVIMRGLYLCEMGYGVGQALIHAKQQVEHDDEI